MRAVSDAGYTQPTPVQLKAIPLVLAGGDLLAGAQTGTGKTAGFTLPILQRLSTAAPRRVPGRPRCLVLTPTRELAAQVEESVRTYGRYLTVDSMVMFGGVNIKPQIEILVLDEADRMLDMGFIRDIRKILALLPKRRQNLLFSATFSNEIRALADGLLHKPGSVDVAPRNAASELVKQSVHLVEQHHKRDLLSHLIRHHDWQQVLVFTRTKHGANRLAEKLARDGIGAAAIHGNKSQSARTQALAGFKDGSLPVLVATDIAARGLDIDQLPRVVNFELPQVPEDYVHRIGRTGRAGSTGSAVSLVDADELKLLRNIERLIRREIARVEVEGFVPPVRIVENAPRAAVGRDGRQRPGAARAPSDSIARETRSGRRSAAHHGSSANGPSRPGGTRRDASPTAPFAPPKPGSRRGRG